MQVTINGKSRSFEVPPSVSALLEALSLSATATIVELNGEVLKKARFGDTVVQEGDRLELIQLVGGG
jgi:thiamine biosynthesis protein ThiS